MNPDGIRKGKIMKAAVKVKNLTKSFGKEKVLKGISHTLEMVMTIGGIVVGAIIICVLVYTIASASGLLKFDSSKNNNSGNTTASDRKSEKDSDSSVKQEEVPDLTKKTPEEEQKT